MEKSVGWEENKSFRWTAYQHAKNESVGFLKGAARQMKEKKIEEGPRLYTKREQRRCRARK